MIMYRSKYRKIRVWASELVAAQERARKTTDDWQARLIEYLLIPKLTKRWREANSDRFGTLLLERHPGKPHINYTPDDNRAIGQRKGWAEYAGYTLRYGESYGWNGVRDEYYSHSASTCYDGIRRETYCGFLDALDAWIWEIKDGGCLSKMRGNAAEVLLKYNIEVLDDLNYERPKWAKRKEVKP